jgi:plasmid stabilization system protein ParE
VTRYALSSEARQDIEVIRAHYLKDANARVARRVLGEITKAFEFLAANPGIGHLRTDLTGRS